MLILGANGHAKEILLVLNHLGFQLGKLAFFDDVSNDIGNTLFSQFPIIRNKSEAFSFLQNTNTGFCLGVGKPSIRFKLASEFKPFGGFISVISKSSIIGNYNVSLGEGLNIMENCMISNEVSISEGTLINAGAQVHHDVSIGSFCDVGPGAKILGGAKIGNFVIIGANATVLPGVRVGEKAVVGAGAVVTKDVSPGLVVVGVPARVF